MTLEEQQAFDILRHRSRDYKLALNAPGVQAMLADLAPFCRAVRGLAPETDDKPIDQIRLAILVGRQQVWERIQNHFHLTTEQLFALYTGRNFMVSDDDANS